MSEVKNEQQNSVSEKAIANSKFMLSMGIVVAVLALAYLLEVVKGSRSFGYYGIFLALLLVPYFVGFSFMKKSPDSKLVHYIAGFGYLILYAFVLFTAATALDFVYVIPLLFAIFVFQDYKFTCELGVSCLIVNVIGIVVAILKGNVSATDIAGYEIQIALIILVLIISIIVAKTIENLTLQRLEQIETERVKQAQILETVKNSTDAIYNNISNVNDESANISEGGKNSQKAIEDIVDGTNELANTVQLQLGLSQQISDLTNQVEEISEQVSSKFTLTAEATEQGRKDMILLAEASNSSKEANEAMSISVESLVEKAEEVKAILSMIQDITSQTTLLSLNASIEAARAGEAGKGFAVVADEIKGLAEDTQKATQNISVILSELQAKTEEANQSMQVLKVANDTQIELVEKTKDVFEQIANDIEDMSDNIMNQSARMKDVATSNAEINNGISSLSSFTEELLANVESTRSLTDDTLQGTTRISEIIDGITKDVSSLQEIQNS